MDNSSDGKFCSENRNEHVNLTYKDVNADIEETILRVESCTNKIVIDSAATKSVVGKLSLENLRETFDEETKEKLVSRREKQSFRFVRQWCEISLGRGGGYTI